MVDLRTPAEIKYDSERNGTLYINHEPADNDAPRCTACTDTLDCPACTAKYEAERQQVHARAAAAPTITERADILLSNHEMPDGDQIFELLMDNHLASFVWYRAIDWVLWRQAHGKPVKRCGDEDDCPAAIDARYDQARALSSNIANYGPHTTDADVSLLCAGEMICTRLRGRDDPAVGAHAGRGSGDSAQQRPDDRDP
jgi:hypothetical protein